MGNSNEHERFQRQSGKTKYMCHSGLRRRESGTEASKRRKTIHRKYGTSKCLVIKCLLGPLETMGHRVWAWTAIDNWRPKALPMPLCENGSLGMAGNNGSND